MNFAFFKRKITLSLIIIILSKYLSKESSIKQVNFSSTTKECNNKTEELLNFFQNPSNSTISFADITGFLFFSGTAMNDNGDYSSCNGDPQSRFILARVNITNNNSISLGICYFKECSAKDINQSKENLIQIINLKFKQNFSSNQVNFSDPKKDMEDFRIEIKSEFIISIILMALIAFLSFIQLFIKLTNTIKRSNKEYESLRDSLKCDKINSSNNNTSLQDEKKNYIMNFFENFDLMKNSSAIFKIENKNKTFEYLRILDGVRFLSTCWVLWGHVFFISLRIGLRNIYDITDRAEKFQFSILQTAPVSVDVFFYLSGFLLYFNIKKYLNEKTQKIKFFLTSLFQRYIRLLPFYFIGIFIITYILPSMIDGSHNSDLIIFFQSCRKYWWHNLLFLQNFYSYDSGVACVPHSWYLANDMIYFILSTVIILVVYKRTLLKIFLFVFIFLFSTILQIIQCNNNHYTNSIKYTSKQTGDFFDDFYIKPWTRITPYLMGILYCELFFETDIYRESDKTKKIQENPNLLRRFNNYLKENDKLCIALFLFSVIEINYATFIILLPQKYDLEQGWLTFFLVFNKIFFINGLGTIIHLLLLDKFTLIKNLLSLTFFSITSRITYGIYILHFYILMIFLYNSDTSFRLDMLEYSCFALSLLLITMIVSYFVGLFYESPIINMLKFLRKNNRKDPKSFDLRNEDSKKVEINKDKLNA